MVGAAAPHCIGDAEKEQVRGLLVGKARQIVSARHFRCQASTYPSVSHSSMSVQLSLLLSFRPRGTSKCCRPRHRHALRTLVP